MVMKKLKEFTKKIWMKFFKSQGQVKLGFYGPPNAGKTSLANKICQDWLGEDIGSVSKIPHETRNVQFKEKVEIERNGKKLEFKLIDTPGIATKIDFEEFIQFGLSKKLRTFS